jgi:hypothetical protein
MRAKSAATLVIALFYLRQNKRQLCAYIFIVIGISHPRTCILPAIYEEQAAVKTG